MILSDLIFFRNMSFTFICQRYLVQFQFLANIISMDEQNGNFIFSKVFVSDTCLHLLGYFFQQQVNNKSEYSKMSPFILGNITAL